MTTPTITQAINAGLNLQKTLENWPTITIAQAVEACGTASNTSKMPGLSTSTPAKNCQTGSKLREIPGSVCEGCYAFNRGAYAWAPVQAALENRLTLVMASRDNPEPWIAGMVKLIWNQEYFRWHDSGDLQGEWHFANIVEVARRTPHVKHWIPSREYRMVTDYQGEIPDNLAVRLSAHKVDGAPPTNLGFPTSTVVTDGTHNCPASIQWAKSTAKKAPQSRRFGELAGWSKGHCSGKNEATGQWEDCRKCWDTTNRNTAYPKH